MHHHLSIFKNRIVFCFLVGKCYTDVVRLAATEISQESRGDKNCLTTTYIFTPVDNTCTEKNQSEIVVASEKALSNEDDLRVVKTTKRPYVLFNIGFLENNPPFMDDYRLNLNADGDRVFGDDLTFGNLYTISKNNGDDGKEERTYDEPYSGDLPRRSWLCCPGSQDRIDGGEQPPLLSETVKCSPTSGQQQEEAITWPPSRTFCSGTCVCSVCLFCACHWFTVLNSAL